jgi:YggT family protein
VITIIFNVVFYVLDLFKWAVILAAVFSMLVSFGVLDSRNRVVWTIGDFLYRLTEPVLRPIRNILPNFGGLDLSPLVVLLLIQLVLQPLLVRVYTAIEFGNVQGLVF